MLRGPLILLLAAAAAPAAEPPRPAADKYPAHASLDGLTIGAEYLSSSVMGRRETYYLKGFLVIDVAVYPARGETIRISADHFQLRLNGKKTAILALPPGIAVLTAADPNWSNSPRLETIAGAGPVILGSPRPLPVPGDPRGPDPRTPLPRPPTVENEDRSGMEREPPESFADVIKGEALIEGLIEQPVRGYLYFPYSGRLKSVKKVDLMFDDRKQAAKLTLR